MLDYSLKYNLMNLRNQILIELQTLQKHFLNKSKHFIQCFATSVFKHVLYHFSSSNTYEYL